MSIRDTENRLVKAFNKLIKEDVLLFFFGHFHYRNNSKTRVLSLHRTNFTDHNKLKKADFRIISMLCNISYSAIDVDFILVDFFFIRYLLS